MSVNYCHRKVGRAIAIWGAIEKSPMLLSQDWKIYSWSTNFIFTTSTSKSSLCTKEEETYYVKPKDFL